MRTTNACRRACSCSSVVVMAIVVVVFDFDSSSSASAGNDHTPIIVLVLAVVVANMPKASRRVTGKDQAVVAWGASNSNSRRDANRSKRWKAWIMVLGDALLRYCIVNYKSIVRRINQYQSFIFHHRRHACQNRLAPLTMAEGGQPDTEVSDYTWNVPWMCTSGICRFDVCICLTKTRPEDFNGCIGCKRSICVVAVAVVIVIEE
jgi:hypothetical protein